MSETQQSSEFPALPSGIQQSPRPVIVYEKAVQAIQQCSTIMEAHHWNNKADALAAWAKVYADDRVMTEARALKLHAYRQIGRLADSLQKWGPVGQGGFKKFEGSTPGARKLLVEEHNIPASKAQSMLTIGRMDEKSFNDAVRRSKPPSPTQLVQFELRPNPFWAELQNRLAIFLTSAKKIEPAKLAESLTEKQQVKALDMITRGLHWLDSFEKEIFLERDRAKARKAKPRDA